MPVSRTTPRWLRGLGYRRIDGHLYERVDRSGYAEFAQKAAARRRASGERIRVKKERDGCGFTWRIFRRIEGG